MGWARCCVRLECACVLGDGFIVPRGLAGELDRAAAQAVTAKADMPSPLLRRAFRLRGGIRSARVYVTSHGLYELEFNGRRVGRDVLRPGWTSYDRRLQYQTYDVTPLLVAGENAVGLTLGDGWYMGPIGLQPYGATGAAESVSGNSSGTQRRLGALLQLRVTYSDGSEEIIGTDGAWKASSGPILASGIYSGEHYDARRERTGWSSAGFDDHDWSAVRVSAPKQTLVAPVRLPYGTRIAAGQNFQDARRGYRGRHGQNMVGWVRLTVRGRRRHDRDHCGTPKCSTATAISTPPICARRVRRTSTPERKRCRNLRTAFHVSRIFVMSPSTAIRNADAGRRHWRGGARGPDRHWQLRDIQSAGESTAAQYPVGAERKLRRRAHRLSAAR